MVLVRLLCADRMRHGTVSVCRRVLWIRLDSLCLLLKVALPIELLPVGFHVEREEGTRNEGWMTDGSMSTLAKESGTDEKETLQWPSS